jgi:hypothetical protein
MAYEQRDFGGGGGGGPFEGGGGGFGRGRGRRECRPLTFPSVYIPHVTLSTVAY